MLKEFLKGIIGVVKTFAIVGLIFYVLYFFWDNMEGFKIYSKEEIASNYELNKRDILLAKKYYKLIIPDSVSVDIEFENDGDLSIFHVYKDGLSSNNWDLDLNSSKTDSLLGALGWSTLELELLNEKLKKANCISVSGDNPTVFGWVRSGMGMYKYDVFDENLNDSLMKIYNDSCVYIFYKENVVFEYGSGAFGSMCFPQKRVKVKGND